MAKGFSYSKLNKFLNLTGLDDFEGNVEIPDWASPTDVARAKFNVVEDAKDVLIKNDGNVQDSIGHVKEHGIPHPFRNRWWHLSQQSPH